ncbi:MAG: response regulator transcription factor [Anaerolineae bacterium]|nr:response regulator transcription factor [Anaerolineae bacterium]
MRPRVLLADDEPAITTELSQLLERAGFRVSIAGDGEEALRQAESFSPDVIVLDVLMPRLDGREALRRLRRSGNWTPVILLTRVGAAGERAMALEEGADDYLNKPFEPFELVARVRAVLRRSRLQAQPIAGADSLRCGPVRLDRRSRRLLIAGREKPVTARALALLEYMMLHSDEMLSRDRLLDAVWGWDYPAGTRAVDARVAELRRALGDRADLIETVVGEGYRFVGRVERGE